MSLDEHYLFSEPFPQRMGDTDQTVAAEEVASGVSVVIHLLAGGNSPVNQEHLRLARDLPPAGVRYLREIGEHRGTPYVVTEPLPDNLSFRAWLGQVTGQPVSAPEPKAGSEPDANKFKKQVWKTPSLPQTVDQPKPGEFTQMLRTGGDPMPARPAAPPPPPPPPPAAKQGPGEFTAMLQTPSYAPPQPAVAPPKPAPPPPPPPAAAKQGPGEFTQMLQTQAAAKQQPAVAPAPPARPTPPPPAPPAPAKQGPGEFTQMLQTQGPMRAQPAGPPPPPASAAPASPAMDAMFQSSSHGTGIRPAAPAPDADEFARMLGDAPAAPLSAPPAATSDYDRTRLFSTPPSPGPAAPRTPPPLDFGSAPAAAPPPARPGSPMAAAQPGEFTRMLQSPMAPPPQGPMFSPPGESAGDKTPGGFTQLFESPFGAPDPSARTYAPAPAPSFPMSRPPSPAPPMYPAKPGTRDPNEFDRLFNEPSAPPVSGSSTKMFSAPQGAAPAAPAPAGPSEYTLMLKSSAKAPSAPAPPAARPAAPAPAAKPPANYMMLIYILGGLLVVAIVVVAYLLLKK